MRRIWLAAALTFALIIATGCVQTDKGTVEDEETYVIGYSMNSLITERWVKDRDFFVNKVEELGGSVIVLSANDDSELQNKQIENLLIQGVDALVIIPHDGEAVATMIAKAKEAGIPVIAYDRLIKNAELNYYISFDNIKVGEEQAKGVLAITDKGDFAYVGGSPTDNNAYLVREGTYNVIQEKIDNGDITVVYDKFTPSWDSVEAYKLFKAFLDENHTVSAVIAANDGTAFGVIQALQEEGLAGTVPVSGQDASLDACKRIVEGTQTVTVYKPIKSIAEKAAEMAMQAAKGETVATTTTVNNGLIDVPAVLLDVIPVTKENMMETVIKDGFQSYDEVYQNIPAEERPEI